jgi:hypothetical protein
MKKAALLFSLTVAATLAAAASNPTAGQSRGWQDREYGVGVVKYAAMYTYAASDVIFRAPSQVADTVALLTRDSLCFSKSDTCVRSYDRMIEFDYEVPGWAILRFSPDSGWAQVTLAPSDPKGPTGWVRLRPDTALAVLWPQLLQGNQLFLLHPTDIAFYRRPARNARVHPRLVTHPGSQRLDYTMKPLVARGAWLQVQLVSPSNMCGSQDPTVRPDTVWIEYLTPHRRPMVFYYTRGGLRERGCLTCA